LSFFVLVKRASFCAFVLVVMRGKRRVKKKARVWTCGELLLGGCLSFCTFVLVVKPVSSCAFVLATRPPPLPPPPHKEACVSTCANSLLALLLYYYPTIYKMKRRVSRPARTCANSFGSSVYLLYYWYSVYLLYYWYSVYLLYYWYSVYLIYYCLDLRELLWVLKVD
jgi:hypothetical protein